MGSQRRFRSLCSRALRHAGDDGDRCVPTHEWPRTSRPWPRTLALDHVPGQALRAFVEEFSACVLPLLPIVLRFATDTRGVTRELDAPASRPVIAVLATPGRTPARSATPRGASNRSATSISRSTSRIALHRELAPRVAANAPTVCRTWAAHRSAAAPHVTVGQLAFSRATGKPTSYQGTGTAQAGATLRKTRRSVCRNTRAQVPCSADPSRWIWISMSPIVLAARGVADRAGVVLALPRKQR